MPPDHVETLTATCPDHDVELTVTTRAGLVPADPLAPPVDQEEVPAVTPNDALDAPPTCPACGELMDVERGVR